MQWMAWTLPTVLFFVGIGLLLTIMTLWEIKSTSIARRGWLPLVTSRGDRLFISLLLAAYLHILWLWGMDSSPWPMTVLSFLLAAVVIRWG